MKEEVLAQYKQGQEQLLSDLYDAAEADGKAGAQASGITQEMVDAARNEGYEAGKASVVIPSTPVGEEGQVGYSEEQYKALETELATAKEQIEAAKTEVAAAKESEAKALSDDATDKEKNEALSKELESKKAMFDKIEAILHPVELPSGEVTL